MRCLRGVCIDYMPRLVAQRGASQAALRASPQDAPRTKYRSVGHKHRHDAESSAERAKEHWHSDVREIVDHEAQAERLSGATRRRSIVNEHEAHGLAAAHSEPEHESHHG